MSSLSNRNEVFPSKIKKLVAQWDKFPPTEPSSSDPGSHDQVSPQVYSVVLDLVETEKKLADQPSVGQQLAIALFLSLERREDDFIHPAFIREIGALVMGSSTYEWILRHHVYADPTQAKPWPYEQPTWVFSSRSQPQVTGAKIEFVQGDVGRVFPAVRDAAGDQNVWVAGGGDLAGQFFDQGLLDEIIV